MDIGEYSTMVNTMIHPQSRNQWYRLGWYRKHQSRNKKYMGMDVDMDRNSDYGHKNILPRYYNRE